MPRPKRGDADVLREAKKRFERCVTWESTARSNARIDRRFANGDAYNNWQWDQTVRTARGDRPCLTHNKVRQHNLQIINDARQNKQSIKVTPVGGNASYEAAQVFEGIIRRIEYQSKAIDAYSTATFHQVETGIGYVSVDTDYVDQDGSFEQEIYIRRHADPETIYIDPDCKLYDKSDARFAFVFEDIPREEWEAEHGENKAPPGPALDMPRSNDWVTKDHVRVAIYWRRNEDEDRLHMLRDGRVIKEGDMDDAQMEMHRPLIERTRTTKETSVEWFRIEGDKIADRGEWAGIYIPIVPWIGEEVVIDGLLDRKGHTRSQIDAQRIYNYWAATSLHTLLPTPTGWTTMGQVKVGDQLLDEQGRPTTVLGKSPVYLHSRCFRVEFDDGSHVTADAGHRWQVEERGKAIAGGWQWTDKQVTTEQLTPGTHFIHMAKPLDLPEADLLIEPYLLGMWLGNGRTAAGTITNHTQDVDETRQYLMELGYRLGPVYRDNNASTFGVYELAGELRELGLLGNKHIPQAYLRASAAQRWALLQGLMDTDGSANRRLFTCEFTTSRPALAEGFAELLSSLGLKSTHLRRAATRRKMPGGEWSDVLAHDQFTFSAPPDVQVFRLRRKRAVQEYERTTHWRRTRRFRIKAVLPVPSEPVQCLGVDAPSHLFLCGPSMVPTHNSAAVEQVALQSKVPYVGVVQAFEGFENYWNTANLKNFAYLPYNGKDDDGNPLPPPQRAPPPEMASAYIQGMQIARQDLLDVTGQYQAELGMPSNERSGVAIQQRQRQGDNATYHYIDNQSKAIRQVGRILLDLIPKIYDTTRVIKILAQDGTDQEVVSTPNAPAAHQRVRMTPQGPVPIGPQQAGADQEEDNLPDPRIIFNPTVGKYDVEADVGPTFGTQRQEAANAFTQILANNPAAFAIVGDFWAKYQDFPGAEELAQRLKRGLPAQYRPGPDPQLQQVIQAGQQMQQQAQQLLKQADAEIARLQADNMRLKEQGAEKHASIAIDEYKAETERLKAVGQIDPASLQVIVRKMVGEMLQTDLPHWLEHHGALEQAFQANMQQAQPQAPNGNGNGGQAPAGNGGAPGNGGMPQPPNGGGMPQPAAGP